jgi:hypothetical protein
VLEHNLVPPRHLERDLKRGIGMSDESDQVFFAGLPPAGR